MMHVIEVHGRLCRAAAPPADPGHYDLRFRLHPAPTDDSILWEDEIHGVTVQQGGYYHVILGASNALTPDLFDGPPPYLSIRRAGGHVVTDELADRVPLLGLLLKLERDLHVIRGRIAALETRLARVDGEGGRVARLEDELEDLVGPDGDVVDLDARLCRLEGVSTPGEHDRLGLLERRIADLETRLKRR